MTDHRLSIRPFRWAFGVLLGTILLGVTTILGFRPESARADLIFLKDGSVFQGSLKRESKLEVDPVRKEPFTVPSGHYWVDDGPRRIYFAQHNVGRVEKKVAPNEERLAYRHKDTIIDPLALNSIESIDAPDFGDNWRRTVLIRTGGQDRQLGQALTYMSPYWARTDATQIYQWPALYLTRELGLRQVRRLLGSHPDFKETPRMAEAEKATRRFRYVDFFTQAGWYDEAELELQRILADLPTQKEKAEAGLKVLHEIIAREKYEEIKRLHLAGQYGLVQKRIAQFPIKTASDAIQADVREFYAEYAKTYQKVVESKRLLGELVDNLGSTETELFREAATTIALALYPGNLDRLDSFLGQARQWARLRKQGQKPENSPEQVLSLAITGWLLGSTAAENKVETGIRLWKARTLALEVLRADPVTRGQLLEKYTSLAVKDQVPLDWFVQMIPHLPPAFPEEETGPAPMALSVGAGRGSGNYVVQLPMEYRHTKSYPVLIVLHDAGEKAEAMLRRWSEAVDDGYIVVAPEWDSSHGYQYSTQDHDLVQSALRDVRARFNVDSDRVFLHGLGQGGTMAFDVGLSHPDLFAGVMPMSGTPDFFSLKYWRNSLYLPLYVVSGEKIGDSGKKTKALFDALILNNYSAIWVQYKGRGIEWFGGEVALILDWMRNKKRSFPMRQLGNDDGAKGPRGEFCCLRPSDSKFYWLSSNYVLGNHLTTAAAFQNQVTPATFFARVDSTENKILVRPTGVKQLTIWLGRNSKGETSIDFDRPVTIQVHLKIVVAGRKVAPSLAILLEDLAVRGDRQQLFMGKVDLSF